MDDNLYDDLCPRGSRITRLHGLAKIHKKGTSVRPVLSMPGCAYHKITEKVADWLAVSPENNIDSSTELICDTKDSDTKRNGGCSWAKTLLPVHKCTIY